MHLDGSREQERSRGGLDHARTMDREAINDSSPHSVMLEESSRADRRSRPFQAKERSFE